MPARRVARNAVPRTSSGRSSPTAGASTKPTTFETSCSNSASPPIRLAQEPVLQIAPIRQGHRPGGLRKRHARFERRGSTRDTPTAKRISVLRLRRGSSRVSCPMAHLMFHKIFCSICIRHHKWLPSPFHYGRVCSECVSRSVPVRILLG